MANLSTTPNFRDFGGLSTEDGGRVAGGRLFRSELVSEPTVEDSAWLDKSGIKLVCDLRGASERDHAPNRWWIDRNVDVLELDILADIRHRSDVWEELRRSPDEAGARDIMLGIYSQFPSACVGHLRIIFDKLVEGHFPILIHCTAGKDRTGFITAMILSALGAREEEIFGDYLASNGRATDQVRNHTIQLITDNLDTVPTDAVIEAIIGVERTYLQQSLNCIAHDFGSMDSYLREAGLTDSARQVLRSSLVEH